MYGPPSASGGGGVSGGAYGPPSGGPSVAALERLQSENQRLTATIAELERGQRRLQTDLAATQEMLSKERHEWNTERARFHSLQSLPSSVQALQQEVMELQAIISNQVAEKRDSDRERQQLELAIADLRMQNLQQQGYTLKVDPALYKHVSAGKLERAQPEESKEDAVFAPVQAELYPRMMLDSGAAALTPLMEMEAALGTGAMAPQSEPPSPLTLALGPFEPVAVAAAAGLPLPPLPPAAVSAPVPAPVPAPASPAQQLRDRLRGMSEKELERRFSAAELAEMLAVFGKLYEKPKPLAARSLFAAVASC